LVPADQGQNNDVLVLADRWVFRFPRHASGVERLPRLARVLRLVRGRVSLPTPDPAYVQLDPPEVGKAFVGHPLLPGEPLWPERLHALAESDPAAVETLAVQLATFLRELHAVPLPDVEKALSVGAPVSSGESEHRPIVHLAHLAHWEDLYERIARRLFVHMRPAVRAKVAARFDAFLGDPRNRHVVPVLIHGDFGTGNWLHSGGDLGGAAHSERSAHISGVIDFDGAHLDDPAVDIAAACGDVCPPLFVAAFRRAYGVTPALEERGRFYRSTFPLQEALFGAEHDDPDAFAAIRPYT
jgi:aminoglycoside 2''-phosphotransferase